MLTRTHKAIIAFNAVYIFGFAAYYIYVQDYEFLWYVAVLLFLFALIGATLHRSKFTNAILWGLSVWGLLHMAGGGVQVGDGVLYALKLIPIVGTGEAFVLKFDQLVHFYGFAVATVVAHHLLAPQLKPRATRSVVYAVVFAAGLGLGALNEIVEFMAVLAFPETGVGGYYNTTLDLVFNGLGALTAVWYIHMKQKKENT